MKNVKTIPNAYSPNGDVFEIFRDPAVKEYDSFRVMFNNHLCSPTFNSFGAARAYVDLLLRRDRKPEYVR